MITSPICQKPPGKAENGVVQFLLGLGESLKKNYTYEHVDGINDMNFGIMDFRPNDDKTKLEIYGKHVISNSVMISGDPFRKMRYRLETGSCMSDCSTCNIL